MRHRHGKDRQKSPASGEVTSLTAVEHLIAHRPERLKRILIQSGERLSPRLEKLYELARERGIPVETSVRQDSDEPGVRALVGAFQYTELADLRETMRDQKRAFVLALDHLQDPHNFGALCRTADGLGASGIVIPKDRSVLVGPGVYHSSTGAVETIPVVSVVNLADSLRKFKEDGFWIVGSTLGENAKPPGEMPDFEKIVLVLGSELEGMGRSLINLCDWLVQIPLTGKVQSLNVSVAGAILMYEMTRRATPPAGEPPR